MFPLATIQKGKPVKKCGTAEVFAPMMALVLKIKTIDSLMRHGAGCLLRFSGVSKKSTCLFLCFCCFFPGVKNSNKIVLYHIKIQFCLLENILHFHLEVRVIEFNHSANSVTPSSEEIHTGAGQITNDLPDFIQEINGMQILKPRELTHLPDKFL